MSYDKQDRGSDQDYAAYFAGMNASMQQKVALTTAHFPTRGVVADMGSGSGAGSLDLAALHDGLSVIGVDINPDAVRIAGQTYQRHNLRFQVGDIGARLFSDAFLDAVLDSSVLHHVTSFNDFSIPALELALDHQVRALRPGGMLVVRDFVVPDGPADVWLDLKDNDGSADAKAPVGDLCTAALFERFAKDFRSSQNRKGPVPFSVLSSGQPGWRRYSLSLRLATEFILRKDYRDHWDVELQEEYLYFSQQQFEQAFALRGLRVVASFPIYNPWIVENRFVGQFVLRDSSSGTELPFPPTNYLIVGEKVGHKASVRLDAVRMSVASAEKLAEPAFIKLSAYKHRATGRVFELCERPHPTLDVVPYFVEGTRCYVIAKQGFPRPLSRLSDDANLSSTHLAGYVTEPLAAIIGNESTEHAMRRVLRERAMTAPTDPVTTQPALRYYPSPGGISERVDAVCVRVPVQHDAIEIPNYTSFTSSGSVRPLEATQLLRAHAIGGMFDARLEVNVFHLLRRLGLPLGPWIGAEMKLSEQELVAQAVEVLFAPKSAPVFDQLLMSPRQFLAAHQTRFVERAASGEAIAEGTLEWVRPQHLSTNTVTILPVVRTAREVLVGLELRQLPAPEIHGDGAAIACVPAARLPRSVHTMSAALSWATQTIAEQFGLAPRQTQTLGGRYFPSLGITPEVVHPLVLEVDAKSIRSTGPGLLWVTLRDVVAARERVRDGHTLVSILRAAHAYGI